MLPTIPPFLRNFYVATGLGFLVWMLFFDSNDLITQTQNWLKMRELEQEVTFYKAQIDTIQANQREVLGNAQLQEKFAREKYLMKKPTEDIYVTVDAQNNPLEK